VLAAPEGHLFEAQQCSQKEDGTCTQILVSQYATDSSQVAVMVPLVPETEKPNPWSLKSAKHGSI
jgi:hypothetical protein